MSEGILVMDVIGPIIGAVIFIAGMSRVPEPARHNFNAVLVAGASSAYLGGGFGAWELVYVVIAGLVVSYLGLRSYRFIAIAWFMHTGWDIAHHAWGQPIWPWSPLSSFGCAIFDPVIGVWFWMGAPNIWKWRQVDDKDVLAVHS